MTRHRGCPQTPVSIDFLRFLFFFFFFGKELQFGKKKDQALEMRVCCFSRESGEWRARACTDDNPCGRLRHSQLQTDSSARRKNVVATLNTCVCCGSSLISLSVQRQTISSPYTLFIQDLARDLGCCLMQVGFSLPSSGWYMAR